MKICIVSVEYPPFRGGGIGTYAYNMSRFLAEAGHEVHVIANSWTEHATTPPPRLEHNGNLWIHRIDAIDNHYGPRPPYDADESPIGKVCRWWDSSLFWSTLAADELERVCQEHQIEVVEYPECYAEAYIAMRRRRLGRKSIDVPMTVTLHSPIYEVTVNNLYRMYEGWFQRRNMMEEYCIRNADMLSCPSQALVHIVNKRLNLDPEKNPCEVIHNPMDFESLPDIPADPTANEEESMSLLAVGRIEPRKGIKYLIDAASLIMDKYPQLKVHLIGKDCDAGEVPGSTVAFMQSRIRQDLRDRFIFEGLRPRAEVLKRYSTATAYIHPAPWDNFPYACCEAMAYGACVVSSDNGGMAEMIEDGESGILFPTRNVPALAAAIERVLNDPELRQRCRRNAGPRIRQLCEPALAVKKRIDHYQLTIERHRRNRRRPVPAEARRSKIALFLPNHTGEPAIRKTIRSAQASAKFAGMDLEVTVVGTNHYHDLEVPFEGVHVHHSRKESDESALELWLKRVAEYKPDYLMCMWPSEILDEQYFKATHKVLLEEDKVAWATTWAPSCHVGSQEPYAGFDFSVPLEMMFYHPVPFALIRYDAFLEVGGWNLELPAGWRQWDLWLAFEQAGWRGLVIPEWHGQFIPYAGIKLHAPDHAKAHEMILQAVVQRNQKLFADHGADLWITHMTNRLPVAETNKAEAEENGKEPSLEDATLTTLVRTMVRRVRHLTDKS
ncbi:MAG: glycosyltransferase family 4 protein [Planctomycetota bacterium]